MEIQFKEFYDILKENIKSYKGDYEEFVDYGPELFKLLTEILNKKEVQPEVRLKISAAIAYFVVPYDIIPEQIYGPSGYIDDIFVCTYVIKEIMNDLGYGVLKNIWDGNGDLKEITDECYEKSINILGEKVYDILAYVGLDNYESNIEL